MPLDLIQCLTDLHTDRLEVTSFLSILTSFLFMDTKEVFLQPVPYLKLRSTLLFPPS